MAQVGTLFLPTWRIQNSSMGSLGYCRNPFSSCLLILPPNQYWMVVNILYLLSFPTNNIHITVNTTAFLIPQALTNG